MGKRRTQTIGYTYKMGLHMGICRGPVNSIAAIKIGDRMAYDNTIEYYDHVAGPSNTGWQYNPYVHWPPQITPEPPTDGTNIYMLLNQPELFGGIKAEGGVYGDLFIMHGAPDQLVNPRLKAMLGNAEFQPEFRGILSVYFDGMVCQLNPYPKPWKFRVRRLDKGWQNNSPWYPAKLTIPYTRRIDPESPSSFSAHRIYSMNGIHIIYECLTNGEWGRGLASSEIDQVAFRAAADTLFDEGFGLCLRWSRSDNLDSFVQMVIDHVGAALYQDKTTGLYTIKLLRFDYDPDTLPVFNTSNGILEIPQAANGSTAEAYNEFIVNYRDPIEDMDAQVRVQNLAAIQATGNIASKEVSYPGVPIPEMAIRLGQRDLRAASVNLRRFRIIADRRLWHFQPGAVFKINDTVRGTGEIIVRVGTGEDGTLVDGKITLVVVQDVFAYQLSPFTAVQPPLGLIPDYTPTAKRTTAYEKPYVELNAEFPPAEFDYLPNNTGMYNYHMERPSALTMSFDIAYQRGSAPFVTDGTGDFTPLAAVSELIDYLQTEITYSATDNIGLDGVEVGQMAVINEEVIRVDAIDVETRTVTIARGVADTVPHRHNSGSLLWFTGDYGGSNYMNYAAAETIRLRGLPWTLAGGRLALDDAPQEEITMNWRFYRPYPPGDVLASSLTSPENPWYVPVSMRYDADGYYDETDPSEPIWVVTPDVLRITWTHRDRVQQADQLIDHDAGNIGPEPGVTYRLRVLDAFGNIVRTETGINATQFNYSYLQAEVDLDVATSPDNPTPGFIELYAMRDGMTSWQGYLIPIRVYKRPAEMMALAQHAQQVMINTDEDALITGLQVAETSQQTLINTDERPLNGLQVAETSATVGHRAVYTVAMDKRSFEAPYISLLRESRDTSTSQLRVCVARPSDRVTDGYDLLSGKAANGRVQSGPCGGTEQVFTDDPSPYVNNGAHPWTPWAVIAHANRDEQDREGWVGYFSQDIRISDTSTSDGVPLSNASIGSLILIDDEWMILEAVNPGVITVRRGVADTVPARHQSGRPVWLCEVNHAAANTHFGKWDKVRFKLNPHTLAAPNPVNMLPEYTHNMMSRPERPYPPGLMLVDGEPWFRGAVALAPGFNPRPGMPKGKDVMFTWAHRNRIWQADEAYDHFAVMIPPEPGVKYVLELWYQRYGAACPTLQRRLETDGNSIVYTAEMALTDGDVIVRAGRRVGCGTTIGTFTLKAVKDGLVSWQAYAIQVRLPTNVVCPTDGGDGGDTTLPGDGSGPGDGGTTPPGTNPGNPNPTDPDNPDKPVDPEYPDPTDPDIDDPDFPDTGEPPIDPPPIDPDNATGWGTSWDHGWAGPQIED